MGGRRRGRRRGRGGLLDIIVDPRIPTTPRRSMSGFGRPGRYCLHQARSAVTCPASLMKGERHPTKNRLRGKLAYG